MWRLIDEIDLQFFRMKLPSDKTKDKNGDNLRSRMTIIAAFSHALGPSQPVEEALHRFEKIATIGRHGGQKLLKEQISCLEYYGHSPSEEDYTHLWARIETDFLNFLIELNKVIGVLSKSSTPSHNS